MSPVDGRLAWSTLRSLLLPVTCCGCGAPAEVALCSTCLAASAAPAPLPVASRAPPRRWAAGYYAGPLRRAVLAFKERRHRALAASLATLLLPVLACIPGAPSATIIHCVPIPATAAARRRRGFDHVALLAAALSRLDARVRVLPALTARPRPDSVGLSTAQRLRTAERSLRVRPSARCVAAPSSLVVIVDDIVTTGATVTTAARVLAASGITAAGAVSLAAVTSSRGPLLQIQPSVGGDITGPTR